MMRLFRVVFAASDLFAFAAVSVAAVDDLNGWARRMFFGIVWRTPRKIRCYTETL